MINTINLIIKSISIFSHSEVILRDNPVDLISNVISMQLKNQAFNNLFLFIKNQRNEKSMNRKDVIHYKQKRKCLFLITDSLIINHFTID